MTNYGQRPQANSKPRGKAHPIAGTFYLIIAIAGIAAAAGGAPAALIVTVLAALYSVYLFRGGRVVIFFF